MTEEEDRRFEELRKQLEEAKAEAKNVRRAFPSGNEELRNRLDLYKWLFWAAVFLILALIVAWRAGRS